MIKAIFPETEVVVASAIRDLFMCLEVLPALNHYALIKGEKMYPLNRSKHSSDIRIVTDSEQTAQPEVPEQVQVPALNEPIRSSENNPFHPGDIVIYKFNQKGTVVSVEGDSVQVDFGLGVHYLSYLVLKPHRN